MMITQVTNKGLIVFLPKEILLDTNAISISTSFFKKNRTFIAVKLFSISISSNVKISLPTFLCDNEFLCFVIFRFFLSNQHFILSYGLIFANSANNTTIISTFNV